MNAQCRVELCAGREANWRTSLQTTNVSTFSRMSQQYTPDMGAQGRLTGRIWGCNSPRCVPFACQRFAKARVVRKAFQPSRSDEKRMSAELRIADIVCRIKLRSKQAARDPKTTFNLLYYDFIARWLLPSRRARRRSPDAFCTHDLTKFECFS